MASPVSWIGQRHLVEAGAQLGDGPGRLGPRRDVVQHAEGEHGAVGVGEEAALHLEVDQVAVAPAQPDFAGARTGARALGQPGAERGIVGVDEGGPAPPHHVLLGHGQQGAGGRVGRVQVPVERREDHALGGALEQDAVGGQPE